MKRCIRSLDSPPRMWRRRRGHCWGSDFMARRWFQFHLSTAIVVQILAAVLIWANLRAYPVQIFFMGVWYDEHGHRNQDYAMFQAHGWPLTAYVENHTNSEYSDTG